MFSLKKPPLPPVLQATGPSKWILFLFVLKVETTSSPPKSILSFFGSQATFPSLSPGEVWSWERQWCVLPPGLAPKNLLQSPLCSFHPLLWLTGRWWLGCPWKSCFEDGRVSVNRSHRWMQGENYFTNFYVFPGLLHQKEINLFLNHWLLGGYIYSYRSAYPNTVPIINQFPPYRTPNLIAAQLMVSGNLSVPSSYFFWRFSGDCGIPSLINSLDSFTM